MRGFILSLALLFTAGAHAQSLPVPSCNPQVPYGSPTVTKADSSTVCHTAYLLQHDNKAKIPVWVSYVLTPEHATGCFARTNAFAPDPALQRGSRSELKDYAKSGYDIGHQANDGDMSWSLITEHESFLLGNMAPQLPGFNRGIWKKLEDQTRAWAIGRNNPLLVYVGPVYSEDDSTIGANRVVVPHAFYKIIVDTVTSDVMVYEFKHAAAQGKLDQFLSTLAQVQQDTGIVFPMPKEPKFADRIWPAQSKSARNAKKGVCSIN